jgi:hypothetical protein
MAKITGPLISLGARGTIGKTAVYSSWRGRAYVRTRVVPANPRSADQTSQRNLFTWLQAVWKVAPTLMQENWTLGAKGQPLTDRNLFSRDNLFAIGKSAVLSTGIVFSAGAKGGTPPVSASIVAAGGTITPTVTVPTPPVGWTVTSVIAACIRSQDPQTDVLYKVTAAEDLTSPYTPAMTGLSTGNLYDYGIWIKWAKPDGSVAYSPQIAGTATP